MLDMLAWAWKRLRRWLLPAPPLDFHLDCLVRGKKVCYLISGSAEFTLIGSTTVGGVHETRTIPEGMAIDKAHWHRLWRYWNPNARLTWASDGERYSPPT